MRITKVTTKKGDSGKTKLGDGQTVPKSDLRIRCLGSIDELNSFIGYAKIACEDDEIRDNLVQIQNQLLNLGGEISLPDLKHNLIKIENVEFLESIIADLNKILQPLKEFVIPGDDEFSARLHIARSVCRRAETMITELNAVETGKKVWIQYLNRLSDFLFVSARYHLQQNRLTEKQWERSD